MSALSDRPIGSPADLEQLDGFAFVAGDPLIATCDDLVAAADVEAAVARATDIEALIAAGHAEALIDAGALVLSLSSRSDLETKRRNLRAMTLGHFARFWRGRMPQQKPELAARLEAACEALAAHLAPLIALRRPAPLDLPRLSDVRSGVFRRRLDNFAPSHARALAGALGYVEHGLSLREWAEVGPALGLPKETRAAFDALVAEVREAEAVSVAPRSQRSAATTQAARTSPAVQAALDLTERQAAAAPPLEVLRTRTSAHYEPDAQTFTVHCQHYLACLESSSCNSATVELSEPLAPHVACAQRPTPCTLKRFAAELYAESLAGIDPAQVSLAGLGAMRAWAMGSASERLLGRLEDLGKLLADVQPDEGEVAWLLTPFEKLELVRLTPKKKGGLKTKRLTQGEAEMALASPRHVITASILKGLRMFQDRRFGYDGLETLGPALAALAGDASVYLAFEGDVKPLAISVGEPRLEAHLDPEGRAQFAITMNGVVLDRIASSRAWVSQLDVAIGRIAVGHISEALRRTAAALLGAPATEIAPEDKERFAESLLALDKRVPVTADKSWLGDAVDADLTWILQLFWSGPTRRASDGSGGKALEARLRVKIVPELGALTPGEGERVLPLRRLGPDGNPHLKHVERSFDGERRAAILVAESLNLGWPGTAAELHPRGEPGRAAGGSAEGAGGQFEWRFVALEEALTFMNDAQELASVGKVELVWETKPLHVTRNVKAERLQLKLGFRRDWLDVRGGFVLDGGELPLPDLLRALRDNKRFVQLDEARFVELGDELRKALAPLASLAREVGGKVVASPLSVPLIEELQASGVDIDTPADWLTYSARMHEAAALEPLLPDGVRAELRPYQLDGFRWIARLAHWARGACLADDMGLGKTLQALVFMLARASLGPTLVIAPTSVVANWTREAARFTPSLDVRRALQGATLDEALAGLGPHGVVVTTWDLLVRHERLMKAPATPDQPEGRPWTTVVLDEAHAMKNAATRRAQAARALDADFVLALTGTPVENRPLELWSLFSVVAPGLLGSLDTFREGFGKDIEARTPEASRRLSRLIRPFMLRRTKAEVAPDLPPKTEVRVDVVLTADERERYQRVRMAAIKELDDLGPEALAGQKGLMRVLAVLTRLRQIACHARLVDPKAPAKSAKLERLVELAEELRGEGRKMLVFSQFTELLALVAKAFEAAKLTFTYLDGSTPGEARVAAVDRFQSGAVDAFLLSLKAGGVGLNLTAATEVIHLDPWWNPAVEDQASDRAHRIGQDKPVTVYRLVANGTIEEQILGLHADKREMVSGLLAGTGSARPLAAEDMAALLSGESPVADSE